MNSKADSTLIEIKLPNTAKIKLDEALKYYEESLIDEDLRRSDYMYAFKTWITSDDADLSSTPDEFKKHVNILKEFDVTYKKHFWSKHNNACKEVLQDHLSLILRTEGKYVEQITKLTRQYWQDPEKVNVDLTYFGNSNARSFRNTPYTTDFPTHIVMNVAGQNDVEGSWLEVLYHEAAHHLILGNFYFVAGTINDLVEAENLKLPSQLWHAYLFYFTGEITKQLLVDNGVNYPKIYMERVRVFYSYFPLLEKHLIPYINRNTTLSEATRKFITDFYE